MRYPSPLVSSALLIVLLGLITGAVMFDGLPRRLNPWAPREEASPDGHPPERGADLSPLPNTKGEFVSAGSDGRWHRPDPQVMVGAVDPAFLKGAPKANCSPEAIVYFAEQAPDAFEANKDGLLYGVRTHTDATRVDDMPGYNSCALVVHAILKKAGCTWAKRTADAKAIYDMAYNEGWRPSDTQEGGCLVAWNSQEPGKRPRIGRGKDAHSDSHPRVLYRHLGIATGRWWSVDNTSFLSRPTAGITYRPFRYESPIFLCPPKAETP